MNSKDEIEVEKNAASVLNDKDLETELTIALQTLAETKDYLASDYFDQIWPRVAKSAIKIEYHHD